MLTDEDRALLRAKNFACFTTLMEDGSPQTSVVWIDLDGDTIVVNSAEGRTKVRNVRRDPRVAIALYDSEDPYRQLMIRGRVTDMTTEGADESIDALAKKYLGVDSYPGRVPGQQRVILRIEPTRVIHAPARGRT